MPEIRTRLALLTPHGVDAAQAEPIAASLTSTCAAGDVAAVVLRLATGDERGLINVIKRLAPAAQEHGAALVVACPGFAGDLASIAARGGADGVHLDNARHGALRDWRERLNGGRILGVGRVLDSRHAAMEAGEAGVDYLMFGGLYADGAAPDREHVRAQAEWWAAIFETPCIAVASAAEDVPALAFTGAEFIGLESALWLGAPDGVKAAQAQLHAAGEAR